MSDTPDLDRRRFLAQSGTAAAGLALAGLAPGTAHAADAPWLDVPGKLVRVTLPGAVKGGKVRSRKILVGDSGKRLVEKALTTFTGEKTAVDALKRFVSADDVVGIKVNCLGSPGLATHPDIAFALADLCQQVGVTPDRLIIYDQYGSRMRRGGYKLRDRKGKIRVIRHWGQSSAKEDPRWGYNKTTMTPAGPAKFCKILDEVTAVINLPVVKDHDLTGVTGAMKNVAYGHIKVVPRFHCNKGYGYIDGKKVTKKGNCQPVCKWEHCNVARMYSHAPLKDKVRFHLADATAVLYQGGPQHQARFTDVYDSVILSTDPVAMDSFILRIVDEHRARHKMVPINEIKRPRRRPAAFIAHAQALGLGIADPAKQSLEEVQLA